MLVGEGTGATAAAPASTTAAATTPPPPAPEKIILRGVHFDFAKANIRPQDAVLDEAAETLKSHPNVTVNVNGYCDAIGSVRYNLRLSPAPAVC
jgi:outer membrane protein OmpA-like peptidoglycan-associated protein